MPKIEPPAPPYVGPPKWHGSSNNKPIRRIVIHCTAGSEPNVLGAARATADFTKRTTRPSSWHYCADSRGSVQLTFDSVVAYHDGTNSNSIGYELSCSLSNEGRGHWDDDAHQSMLRIAAKDCAQLALAYGVPIVKLGPGEVRRGDEGFCGHVDMRDAFPGSTTHWDPGPFFPWALFMRMVQEEADALMGAPEMVEFGVVTHNIRHALKPTVVEPDVRRLMARSDVDVVLLQEMGGRRDVLTRAADAAAWDLVMPDDPDVTGESATPILYDPAVWDLKRGESIQATEATVVPERAAGPSKYPPKWITAAHLLHRETGRTVHVYNGHWPASQHIKEMRALADTMTTVLETSVADDKGPVIVGGDWNNTKPQILAGGAVDRLELISVTEARKPKLATHRKRLIDWLFHRSPDLKPVGAWVLTGYASDHRPLLGRFALTVKAPAKRKRKR